MSSNKSSSLTEANDAKEMPCKYPKKERPQGRRKDDNETSLETSRQVKAGGDGPHGTARVFRQPGIDRQLIGGVDSDTLNPVSRWQVTTVNPCGRPVGAGPRSIDRTRKGSCRLGNACCKDPKNMSRKSQQGANSLPDQM